MLSSTYAWHGVQAPQGDQDPPFIACVDFPCTIAKLVVFAMPSAVAPVVGGTVACMVGTWYLWQKVKEWAFSMVADRATGQQRRKAAPPHVQCSLEAMPGCFMFEAASSKTVVNERGFLTVRNGQNIFYQTWAPSGGKAKAAIIIYHGFGDQCDFSHALKAKALCNLGSFVVAAFDLPGHGRSDGTHVCIPDWFEFVDVCREITVEHLMPLMKQRWGNLKFFGIGESMGGGVLYTMLVREKELLDGAVLICPMLFVSRELFPPWIVVQIFKYVGVTFLPEWPVAPNKDLFEECYSDPKTKKFLRTEATHHMKLENKAKPRLITAWQLAFVAGEWMKDKVQEFDTPALIIHGGGDVVTDQRVSQELFEKMRNPDKTFSRPEGVWHADLFHGGPSMHDAVKVRFDEVVSWLSKRS